MPTNNNKVQFDEPGMAYNRGPRRPRQSWLISLVIKLGFAKDAKQAVVVLAAIGVLAIVLAFIFWPRSNYEIVPQPGIQGGVSYLVN